MSLVKPCNGMSVYFQILLELLLLSYDSTLIKSSNCNSQSSLKYFFAFHLKGTLLMVKMDAFS